MTGVMRAPDGTPTWFVVIISGLEFSAVVFFLVVMIWTLRRKR